MLFLRSIRGRFLLWLAILLTCVLSAFGVVAHRLRQASAIEKVDEDLERNIAAVGGEMRGTAEGRDPNGPPPLPGERRNGPRSRTGGGWDEPPPGDPPPEPPDRRGFAEPRGGPGGPGGGPGGPRGGNPGEPFRGQRPRFTPSATLAAQFDANDPLGTFFVLTSPGGRVLSSVGKVPAGLVTPKREGNDLTLHRRTLGELREVWHFNDVGDCVLVGRSLAGEIAAGRQFAWLLAAAGAGVLLIALGGGWWLVAGALRPVQAISATATRIAAGDLTDRIDAADAESELGRLAEVLNGTFARLEAAFLRQRQFTADASHELRTPLAVLISEAQGTLARPRTAEEYRETIETCLDTAQQMRRLTESLLTLARFDNAQTAGERHPVNLAVLAQDVADRLRFFAKQHGISVQLELAPVIALGDSLQLQQVVTNLLSNAIQYSLAGEPVTIITGMENGHAMLSVVDAGIGISAEDQPHVFERFFRADRARARTNGHTGLGLAICEAIVAAHGGEISVLSELGQGSTFTVRLPAAATPPESLELEDHPAGKLLPSHAASHPSPRPRLDWPPT